MKSSEVPRDSRFAAPRSLLVASGIATVITILALFVIDRPLAKAVFPYEPLAIWDGGIEILEYAIALPVWRFALPVGLCVGMLVTMAVPRWRSVTPAWIFVAGTHLVVRYTTGHLKDLTGRIRPPAWFKKGGDTFFRDGASFPSGHVGLFASVLIPLAILYPRARIPLLGLAAFVAIARIGVSAHWLSDTTAAIALVTLVAYGMGELARPVRPAGSRR